MSGSTSPTTGLRYGRQRVCQIWKFPRSTLYNHRRREPLSRNRPGPKPKILDVDLVKRVKRDLEESPFFGEGHRKVYARLKRKGYRAGRHRVLRVMKENRWLSPHRSLKGPKREHDRHIITSCPNQMWGTDGAKIETVRDGWVWLFTVVEHWNTECLGWHVTKKGDRHAALEAIGNALKYEFGAATPEAASGVKLRLDHGPQYTSEELCRQVSEWGFTRSPAFVRQPETNGVVERFNRTLKEQVIHGRVFETVEEVRIAMEGFVKRYNEKWLVQKLGYKSPVEAKLEWKEKMAA